MKCVECESVKHTKIKCTYITVIGKAVGIECDPDELVSPGFGRAYKDSERSVEQMDSNMEVGLRYKVKHFTCSMTFYFDN